MFLKQGYCPWQLKALFSSSHTVLTGAMYGAWGPASKLLGSNSTSVCVVVSYYCIALNRLMIYYCPCSKLVMKARKLPQLKMYQALELTCGTTHIVLLKTERSIHYTEQSDEFLLLLCAGSNWLFSMCIGAGNFFLGPIESDAYGRLSSCGGKF
jgi:hypothetical protein